MFCKGKTVVVISEASPCIIEEGWMEDLIRLFGAQPLEGRERSNCGEVPWREIVTGNGVSALVSAMENLNRPSIPNQDDTYRLHHVEVYRHKHSSRLAPILYSHSV